MTFSNSRTRSLLNLRRVALLLLSSSLLLVVLSILHIGVTVTVETDAIPGKIEETIHALQTTARGLGHREEHPQTTDEGDGSETPECALRGDTTVVDGKKHVGDSAGVTVLETMSAHVKRIDCGMKHTWLAK